MSNPEDVPEASSGPAVNEDLARVVQTILAVRKETDDPNLELEEWFNCLENSVKRSYADVFCLKTRKGTCIPLTQLSAVLRECMLSHRWAEAVPVLSAIMRLPSSSRQTIHRVGVEILYNAASQDQEYVEQFFNQVKRLRNVGGSHEVVLEHAMYLLMIGKVKEASQCFNDIPKKVGGRYKRESVRDAYTWKVYMGYVGITHYIEFCMIREGIGREGDTDKDGDMRTEHEKMVSKASLAIDSLRSCLREDLSGNWDIFITTLVEMLEFQQRSAEALELLEKYAAQNTDNPNALRYLMQYHKRHRDQQNYLKYMKQFCDAVPSDGMVLKLYEKLTSQECPASESLPLIFDLLDYGVWASQVKPWASLANHLESIIKSDDTNDQACMSECWQERRSWWPSYHFTCPRNGRPSTEDFTLTVHKARVAAVVIDPDFPFVQDVLTRGIPSDQIKPLRKCIKRLQKRKKKEKHDI